MDVESVRRRRRSQGTSSLVYQPICARVRRYAEAGRHASDQQAAHDEGFYLMVTSSYRDYASQKEIYDYRKATQGERKADETAARPGHSEHQTGLALDVRSSTHWDNLTDADYEWMLNNSYKYGFIIRYPKNNSTITGYQEEPWHIRYIGVEHATKVHELGITYDEYYDLYLTKH